MINEAIVLCGGRGQRLRPYTDYMPKPMLKVAGRPVLEYVVTNLERRGIKKAYFAMGYLGEKIEDYFKDGKNFNIEIEYFYEKEPQNTGGALLSFKNSIEGSDFFVASGDHITSWNLTAMGKKHLEKKNLATIGLIPKRSFIDYGVAEVRDEVITDFTEKPMEEYLINTGIYAAKKELLDFIKPYKDISKDVFPELIKQGKKLTAYIDENEFWIDIGRVSDFERMNDLLSAARLERELFKHKH